MPILVHYWITCIGCNSCVENAPAFWKMSVGDGKSFLQRSKKKGYVFILQISDAELEENIAAAEDCPVNIIKIEDIKKN